MDNESKKRRSFVDVRRKSLLLDKIFSEDQEPPTQDDNPKLTMEQYFTSLKEERLQWKDILKSRQKQLGDLKNRCHYETLKVTESEVESYLSEEDRAFLNDTPDYFGMLQCANKYLKALNFLKIYKSDLIEHYDEVLKKMEIEKDKLIDKLCANDLCELCNMKNCDDDTHKFAIM